MLSQDWGTFQRSEPKYCEGKTQAFLFPSFKHAHKLTMQINNQETQNIELLVLHAFWSALNESGPQSLIDTDTAYRYRFKIWSEKLLYFCDCE